MTKLYFLSYDSGIEQQPSIIVTSYPVSLAVCSTRLVDDAILSTPASIDLHSILYLSVLLLIHPREILVLGILSLATVISLMISSILGDDTFSMGVPFVGIRPRNTITSGSIFKAYSSAVYSPLITP